MQNLSERQMNRKTTSMGGILALIGSKLYALLRSWLLIGWFGGCLIGLVSVVPARGDIAAPQLKWEKAGCYSSWCETGWYSSPAVADLDSNGRDSSGPSQGPESHGQPSLNRRYGRFPCNCQNLCRSAGHNVPESAGA